MISAYSMLYTPAVTEGGWRQGTRLAASAEHHSQWREWDMSGWSRGCDAFGNGSGSGARRQP